MLHPAQTVDVAMPEFGFADQGTFMCSSCTKRFKNKQGRSIYIKCLHCGGTVENNNWSIGGISFPENLNRVDKDKVI